MKRRGDIPATNSFPAYFPFPLALVSPHLFSHSVLCWCAFVFVFISVMLAFVVLAPGPLFSHGGVIVVAADTVAAAGVLVGAAAAICSIANPHLITAPVAAAAVNLITTPLV